MTSYRDEPQDIDLLWPDPERGPWGVRLWFGWLDGRFELVGVEMRSQASERDDPASAWGRLRESGAHSPTRLTTPKHRDLPLGRLANESRRAFADLYREWAESTSLAESDLETKAEMWESSAPSSRAATYGSQHFVEVARVYSEALGETNAPTMAVAKHFSVTKSAAAKWVARARSMGFLPPARKGYPG